MKILVTGGNKSGTTALAFAVGKLFPELEIVTEPAMLGPSADRKDDLIVKYLRPEIFQSNLKHFKKFDIRILIVRHPFDRLVSGLYYGVYGASGFSNDENVNRYLDLIARRVAGEAVSFGEVYDLYNAIVDIPLRFKRDPILHQTAATLDLYRAGLGFHVIRYEDFIDGRTEALDAVLGGSISPKVDVPGRVARVARTKSYGEWRAWFTQQDAARFGAGVEPFAATFGYDLAVLDAPREPVAESGLAYIENLINEMRRKNGLPEFVRGAVNLGPEGDRLDRALFALRRQPEEGLALFEEAVRMRPGLPGFYRMALRAALVAGQDDAALKILDRAASDGAVDIPMLNMVAAQFVGRGAAQLKGLRDLLDARGLRPTPALEARLATVPETN